MMMMMMMMMMMTMMMIMMNNRLGLEGARRMGEANWFVALVSVQIIETICDTNNLCLSMLGSAERALCSVLVPHCPPPLPSHGRVCPAYWLAFVVRAQC
jgi:hypothetical protein